MGRELGKLTGPRPPMCLSGVARNGESSAGDVVNAVPERTIFLAGGVEETSIANVMAQMLVHANRSADPIYLVISTYGGNVHDMFGLYDLIKIINCPVRTVGLGKIMSAGVLLLAAGQRGHRLLGESATVMMHPVTGGAYGNPFELAAETREIKRIYSRLIGAMQAETGLDEDRIKKIMRKGHDVYTDAAEALELGICDKLIGAGNFTLPTPGKQSVRGRDR